MTSLYAASFPPTDISYPLPTTTIVEEFPSREYVVSLEQQVQDLTEVVKALSQALLEALKK